ncbi:MAG: hypothetical protein KC503_24510 [Myxococcales bacterium]|nr:hypothetical protein [Myxococcales bacterium]
MSVRIDARGLRRSLAELDFLDDTSDERFERLAALLGQSPGVDRVELESHAVGATARHFDWTFEPSPQPRSAELYLVRSDGSEELLAAGDGALEGLIGSLRSTDPGGEVFEVVDVGAGTHAGDYQRVRKFGERVVFAWGHRPRAVVHEALAVRGAAGLLLGPRPETAELSAPRDALFAAQLGAPSTFGGKRPFAFQLGPRSAERLRAALASEETTRVRACVGVQMPPRELPLLSACMAGSDLAGEELLLACDLSRPQSALGIAALLEVMRAIGRAVVAGESPPPRRTLRFVITSGLPATVAWLASDKAPRPIAALQLSIAQTRRQPRLLVQDAPPSAPTFLPDLVERLVAEQAPPQACLRVPYRAGSSVLPFVDPSVAVPAVLLAAPGSARPGERRSNVPLQLAVTLAHGVARCAETLASLGERDLPRLLAASELAAASRIAARARRLGETLHEREMSSADAAAALADVEEDLHRALDDEARVLDSVARYLGAGARAAVPIADATGELRQLARAAVRALHAQILAPFEGENVTARARPVTPLERRASLLRVRRTFVGPPPLHSLARELDDDGRAWLLHHADALQAQPAAELLLGFVRADEPRSFYEVARDLEHAHGPVDLKLLWRYLELLERAGLVELAEEQSLGTPQEIG